MEAVHVGGQTVYWLTTGAITILFSIIAFWVKRWIGLQDRLQEEWLKQGGVVTREKMEIICNMQRAKCPANVSSDALCDWRENIMEKGGPLTKSEHTAICKEITKEVANQFTGRIEELFKHHREWVGQELKIILNEQKATQKQMRAELNKKERPWEVGPEPSEG